MRYYYVEFVCNGEESDIYSIGVKTSISTVTFSEDLDDEIYQDSFADYEILSILKIKNAQGDGVPGKSISELTVYYIYIYI